MLMNFYHKDIKIYLEYVDELGTWNYVFLSQGIKIYLVARESQSAWQSI